jgi:hypothetical protein
LKFFQEFGDYAPIFKMCPKKYWKIQKYGAYAPVLSKILKNYGLMPRVFKMPKNF